MKEQSNKLNNTSSGKSRKRDQEMKSKTLLLMAAFTAVSFARPSLGLELQATAQDVQEFWAKELEKATRTSTAPRIRGGDMEKGISIFEDFSTKYLPKSYSSYLQVREEAKEKERILKENFPSGRASDVTGGGLYDKVKAAAVKSVAEMFRRQDEISSLFLLKTMGAVDENYLSEVDSTSISVILPDEGELPLYDVEPAPVFAPDLRDFASKHLFKSLSEFDRLGEVFQKDEKTYFKWFITARNIDAFRSGAIFEALQNRLTSIRDKMSDIIQFVSKSKLLFAVGEITEDELTKFDDEQSSALQLFENESSVGVCAKNGLSSGVWRANNPVMLAKRIIKDMVLIQSGFLICKYEVTQSQWEILMGTNPSGFKGLDNPVENVYWSDCKEFIKKLNSLSVVKSAGYVFRLPTLEEWKRAAGECPMYQDEWYESNAWYESNSRGHTHPVGQKDPNSFGLYDMFGNVYEMTSTIRGSGHASQGGAYNSCWGEFDSDSAYAAREKIYDDIGFRLCADTEWSITVREEQNRIAAEAAEKDAKDKEESARIPKMQKDAGVETQILPGMVSIPGRDFLIAKTEVTQGQWEPIMGSNPSSRKGSNLPVDGVSRTDCRNYIERLNSLPAVQKSGLVFRFPTEEEWEFACKAGARGRYSMPADGMEVSRGSLGLFGWDRQMSSGKIQPVGTRRPNAFGLYDMHGNVQEWTQSDDLGVEFALRGGHCNDSAGDCSAISRRPVALTDSFSYRDHTGLRLCADKK